jgi:hypothetical protein
VVDEDGTLYLQVAKGGVFSYYEFAWPAEDRLTDEKWRQMLDEGQAPPPPAWIESFFTTEGEHSELAAAILAFQKSLTWAVWRLAADDIKAAGLEGLRNQIEIYLAKKQYEGHQLLHSSVRSSDRQAQDLAVVTVRETWQDQLYAFRDFPGEGESAAHAQRGPYTLDVTYMLEWDETGWQVTRVVYANEPPNW